MNLRACLPLVFIVVCAGCRRADEEIPVGPYTERDANGRPATLISAFFGLDDSLPPTANALCLGAGGRDGMPVVLSHTIEERTLQKEDFLVITQKGSQHAPFCVTLAPAVGRAELRTVLLVGNLGSASDPPVTVRVVGDILSDGTTGGTVNFRGAEAPVIPLDRGPTLVWAEVVTGFQEPQRARNAGSECPAGTTQIVRATWAGGIRLPDGNEVGDAERALYRVTLGHEDGSRAEVTPFALADLDDNDNNHSLCLDRAGTPLHVSFPAGHVVDPNRDLNPATEVTVTALTPRR